MHLYQTHVAGCPCVSALRQLVRAIWTQRWEFWSLASVYVFILFQLLFNVKCVNAIGSKVQDLDLHSQERALAL